MINRQQMLKHGYVFDNKLFKQIILINFNNDIEAIGVSNWIYTNVGGYRKKKVSQNSIL